MKQSNIVYNLVLNAREAHEFLKSFWCLKCLNMVYMWMAVFYQIKDEFWPIREGDILYGVPVPTKHGGGGARPPVHPLIDAYDFAWMVQKLQHLMYFKS